MFRSYIVAGMLCLMTTMSVAQEPEPTPVWSDQVNAIVDNVFDHANETGEPIVQTATQLGQAIVRDYTVKHSAAAFIGVFMICFSIFGFRYCQKVWNYHAEKKNENVVDEQGGAVVGIIICIVIFCVGVSSIYDHLPKAMSPTYHVTTELIDRF